MKNYVFDMHKRAYEHLNDGVSYDEMIEFLRSSGYETTGQMSDAIDKAYGDIFLTPVDFQQRASHFRHQNSHIKWTMASEALFRYLDYLEYKLAGKNSRQAQKDSITAIKYARWALIATIVVGLSQIIVAVVQLCS